MCLDVGGEGRGRAGRWCMDCIVLYCSSVGWLY